MWLDIPNNIPGSIVVLSLVLGVLLIRAQFGLFVMVEAVVVGSEPDPEFGCL